MPVKRSDYEIRNENTQYKKSIKAQTTGKVKRQIKKATVPTYGKKGTGAIKNPKKAVYNKAYKKTTFSFWNLFK